MNTASGLAQRIKAARGPRKLAPVARAVGVHRVTFHRYEAGDIEPGGDVLVRIAAELGVTAEWLVRGDVPGGGDVAAA